MGGNIQTVTYDLIWDDELEHLGKTLRFFRASLATRFRACLDDAIHYGGNLRRQLRRVQHPELRNASPAPMWTTL